VPVRLLGSSGSFPFRSPCQEAFRRRSAARSDSSSLFRVTEPFFEGRLRKSLAGIMRMRRLSIVRRVHAGRGISGARNGSGAGRFLSPVETRAQVVMQLLVGVEFISAGNTGGGPQRPGGIFVGGERGTFWTFGQFSWKGRHLH